MKISIMQVELAPGEALPPQIMSTLEAFRGNGQVASGNGAVPAAMPVTEDMIRMGLNRRRLKASQKKLLGALYRADDWLGANEICERLGMTRLELTGTMGGLGLRYRGVPGWPNKRNGGGRPTRALFEHDRREHQDFYKMTDMLRQVIKSMNLID